MIGYILYEKKKFELFIMILFFVLSDDKNF